MAKASDPMQQLLSWNVVFTGSPVHPFPLRQTARLTFLLQIVMGMIFSMHLLAVLVGAYPLGLALVMLCDAMDLQLGLFGGERWGLASTSPTKAKDIANNRVTFKIRMT